MAKKNQDSSLHNLVKDNKKPEQEAAQSTQSSQQTQAIQPVQQTQPTQTQDNAVSKGLKFGRIGLAVTGFMLATVRTVTKAVSGDLVGAVSSGISNIGGTLFTVAGLTNSLKEAKNYVENKLKESPAGKAIAEGASKAWNVVTSKPVKRGFKIATTAMSLALAPTPLGIVAGTAAMSAVAYGVAKEAMEVRENKNLEKEINLLKRYENEKEIQGKLLQHSNQLGNPNLSKLVTEQLTTEQGKANNQQQANSNLPPVNKGKEILKSLTANIVEGASVALAIANKPSAIGGLLSGTVLAGGVLSEAEAKIADAAAKHEIKKEVNNLKEKLNYKNIDELEGILLNAQANTEKLTKLVQDPRAGKLTEAQCKEKFNEIGKEVNDGKKFDPLAKKNIWQKMYSGMKSVVNDIKDSQLSSFTHSPYASSSALKAKLNTDTILSTQQQTRLDDLKKSLDVSLKKSKEDKTIPNELKKDIERIVSNTSLNKNSSKPSPNVDSSETKTPEQIKRRAVILVT